MDVTKPNIKRRVFIGPDGKPSRVVEFALDGSVISDTVPSAPVAPVRPSPRPPTEPPPPPPPLWKMAYDFGKAAVGHALAGSPKCTEDQIKERLAICEQCPSFIGGTCNECGCICSGKPSYFNKLAWATEECPHPDGPKWKAIA